MIDRNETPDAPDAAVWEVYLERVQAFLEQVKAWFERTSVAAEPREDVELREEAVATHRAPTLALRARATGEELARLQPAGAVISAAAGRIALIGPLDREPFVCFLEGGPGWDVPGPRASGKRQVFRGVGQAGWYWLENPRLGRARPVDRGLLFELVRSVSDYQVDPR